MKATEDDQGHIIGGSGHSHHDLFTFPADNQLFWILRAHFVFERLDSSSGKI